MSLALRVGRGALDLLLPPHCLTCDAEVRYHGGFCADCFRSVHLISDPACLRCGAPLTSAAEADAAGACPRCAAAPPPWGRARGALAYDEASRRAILPLKHAVRTELADALAPLMLRAGKTLLAEADVLVPVPLHRTRLFARRYNQAALLAIAVARRSGHPVVPDALQRLRATASLADKDHIARAREMHDAIAIRPRRRGAIAGRRVLLIDDVLTSGATAGACTRALLAAGAQGVDVLVAARVPDKRAR